MLFYSKWPFSMALFIIIFDIIAAINISENNLIYYSAPSFDLKYSNVTFSAAKIASELTGDPNSVFSVSRSIAAICQADFINSKSAAVSMSGIINIAIQTYFNEDNSGMNAIMNIMENDLFFTANGTRMKDENVSSVTGFFSLNSFGTTIINSKVANFFEIPTISVGDSAQASVDNSIANPFPAQNYTFYDILYSIDYRDFNAVVDICNFFNWTLVGNLFDADTYGFTRQLEVLTFSDTMSIPIFTCSYLVRSVKFSQQSPGTTNQETAISDYCACINELSLAQVTILWMSTSAAISVISYVKKTCKNADKWTFLVTDDSQSPIAYVSNRQEVLANVLLLRNNGPWNWKGFVEDCQRNASPAAQSAIESLIPTYFRLAYNCIIDDEGDLEICPDSLMDRASVCQCNGRELAEDPYAPVNFFSVDMVSTYAAGIYLLQNNCTFLNEMHKDLVPIDFCALTSFTPKQLSFAMRFVNFTGYTGGISFSNQVLLREYKTFYLYSTNTTVFDSVLVGELSSGNSSINASLVFWNGGKIPTSEIVPQNPDLSYGLVAFFFGIAIAEIVVILVVFVLFLVNFDDRVIRQSTPYVSLLILLGVFEVALAQLFSSFARTDGWCLLDVYLVHVGLVIIILGLIVKNYRIYRIFGNKTAVALNISETKLLVTMLVVIGAYIVYVTVFVAVFGYNAFVHYSSDSEFYEYYECGIENSTWNTIFDIVYEASIAILLLVLMVMTWLTRGVGDDYRETKSLTSFSVVFIVGYIIYKPLAYSISGGVNSALIKFALRSEFGVLVVVTALGIVYIPKLVLIYHRRIRSESENEHEIE